MTDKQKLYAQLHRIAIKMKPGHVKLPPHWRIGVRLFNAVVPQQCLGYKVCTRDAIASLMSVQNDAFGVAIMLLHRGELLVQNIHSFSPHCEHRSPRIAILWSVGLVELGHGRYRCSLCGHLCGGVRHEVHCKPNLHVSSPQKLRKI